MVSGGGGGGRGSRNWNSKAQFREKKPLIWKVANQSEELESAAAQERPAPASQHPSQAGDVGAVPAVSAGGPGTAPIGAESFQGPGGSAGLTSRGRDSAAPATQVTQQGAGPALQPDPDGGRPRLKLKKRDETLPDPAQQVPSSSSVNSSFGAQGAQSRAQGAQGQQINAPPSGQASQSAEQSSGWAASSSMSASAYEFVPSFSVSAKPFVPGQSFSAGAQSFVPGQATNTQSFAPPQPTGAQSFVPGQSSWGWQEASWQPKPQFNAYAAEYDPAARAGASASSTDAGRSAPAAGPFGGAANAPQSSQGMNMEQWAAWFNDAYMSESSDEDDAPPRAKANPKAPPSAAAKATAPAQPGAAFGGAPKPAPQPPPGFQRRTEEAPAAPPPAKGQAPTCSPKPSAAVAASQPSSVKQPAAPAKGQAATAPSKASPAAAPSKPAMTKPEEFSVLNPSDSEPGERNPSFSGRGEAATAPSKVSAAAPLEPPVAKAPPVPAKAQAATMPSKASPPASPLEPPVAKQAPEANPLPAAVMSPTGASSPSLGFNSAVSSPKASPLLKSAPPSLQVDVHGASLQSSPAVTPKSIPPSGVATRSTLGLPSRRHHGPGEDDTASSDDWEELPDPMEEVDEEVNEQDLQKWLQRFIYDSDAEALLEQWANWTADGESSQKQIVGWLLRLGLDDCRQAKPVTDIYTELLASAELAVETVEESLAEFSEEDLDDVRLDNPKVDEFIIAVRKLFDEFRISDMVGSSLAADAPQDGGSATVGTGNEAAASAASPNADADTVYEKKFLLMARQHCNINEWSGAKWRTQKASKLFAPMPSWQQHRMKDKEERKAEAGGEKEENWRDAQKRVIPEVKKKGNDTRKKEPQQLQVSGTSWVAQIRRLKEKEKADVDAEADAAFLRELRLTLNKLTIERFEQLSDHMVELISKSSRPNRGIPVLMQLVFEKATTQHHFIDMYVNLCVKLHKWLTAHEDLVTDSQTNFKRILLNQCQNSFEQYLEPPGGLDGLKGDILYEAQVKYKTKMLGNIKLIGELIRHGMLSAKIALAVAAELAHDDPLVREERLETLAVFLETIGPSLDDPSWSHFSQFDDIFQTVNDLVENRTVPRRIRYLLRDVVDMRKDKWRTRKARAFESDAPMTIAEVHRKAFQDQFTELRGGAKMISLRAARKEEGILSSEGERRKRKKRRRKRADGSSTTGTSGTDTQEHNQSESDLQTSGAEKSDSQRRRRAKPTDVAPSASASVQAAPEPVSQQGPESDLDSEIAQFASPIPKAKPREELLINFHKEVAQIIRQLGTGVDVISAVQRLHACPVPADCYQEEIIDMLARMVDEPRARRGKLFPLLPALFSAGVFSPPRLLGTAVSTFVQDAFDDPGSVDPPDLGDIVLRELLPALGLAPDAVTLPPCLADLVESSTSADDRGKPK